MKSIRSSGIVLSLSSSWFEEMAALAFDSLDAQVTVRRDSFDVPRHTGSMKDGERTRGNAVGDE